ncbi:MAG: cyclic nucleotide-binding domain-containing protein [Thiohalomonadaceae bacterium]
MSNNSPSTEEIINLLGNVPLFAEVSASALQNLASNAHIKQYERNQVVFRASDLPEDLHVLILGSIQLDISTAEDREAVLELLQPHETFVVAAALTAQPYLMSAHAVEPSTVLHIPVNLLLSELRNDPELSLALLGSMAQQYRYLVREIKGLRLRTASQRLALYFLHLSENTLGDKSVRLPYEKKLLAARLGMTPESFSRAIAELRRHGAEVQGDTIHITNLDTLHRYCRLDQVLDTLEKGLRVMLPEDE